MKRNINYIQLGGTLFIPATHKNLKPIISRTKYPDLHSLVIDFEDGLNEQELQKAYEALSSVLRAITEKSPFVFIRPRDENHLKILLEMENIEAADGFVLPKFSLTNANSYLDVLGNNIFYIMPSIEGKELFSVEKLQSLQELLVENKEKVLLVRFGLEDMLRQLSMRRTCNESIFDFSVGNVVLGNFIAVFKSAGFAISGGVYPCFKDESGFEIDVKRDLKEGLFGKTIIHPAQIELLNELYQVSQDEYDEAKAILQNDSVVFRQNNKMAETKTMANYSEFIVKRADVYGIRN